MIKVMTGALMGFVVVLVAKSNGLYLQSPWINESEYLRQQYDQRRLLRA